MNRMHDDERGLDEYRRETAAILYETRKRREAATAKAIDRIAFLTKPEPGCRFCAKAQRACNRHANERIAAGRKAAS